MEDAKMSVTERELAHALCAMHAHTLVDEAGEITIGGATLGDLYFQKFCGSMNIMRLSAHADALRHWVAAAGYNEDNEFEYIISNTIQNC